MGLTLIARAVRQHRELIDPNLASALPDHRKYQVRPSISQALRDICIAKVNPVPDGEDLDRDQSLRLKNLAVTEVRDQLRTRLLESFVTDRRDPYSIQPIFVSIVFISFLAIHVLTSGLVIERIVRSL